MRILHIVSYVSTDGAFGGPVAVAVAQAEELARRGHDVELWAGYDGIASLAVDGVRVRLFRTTRVAPGFSGLLSIPLERAIRAECRKFDVVHVHLARDLLTTRAAALIRASAPYVVQPHGMVMPDARLRARLWDRMAIRKILQGAGTVLALSAAEEAGLQRVARGRISVERVWNGVRIPVESQETHRDVNSVAFLARLHPRKRVGAFAAAAKLVGARAPHLTFRVIGPDEGDLPALEQFIRDNPSVPLKYEGAVAPGQAAKLLGEVGVYVLPSFGEVVPMTVLEAIAASTPVVLTSDCALAPLLTANAAAIVTDGSPEELANAILKLVSDQQLRTETVRNGQRLLEGELSIKRIAEQLESRYVTAASAT